MARTPSRYLADLPAEASEEVDPGARESPAEAAAAAAAALATLRARLGGGGPGRA
mgnify:CR=1 FL=1